MKQVKYFLAAVLSLAILVSVSGCGEEDSSSGRTPDSSVTDQSNKAGKVGDTVSNNKWALTVQSAKVLDVYKRQIYSHAIPWVTFFSSHIASLPAAAAAVRSISSISPESTEARSAFRPVGSPGPLPEGIPVIFGLLYGDSSSLNLRFFSGYCKQKLCSSRYAYFPILYRSSLRSRLFGICFPHFFRSVSITAFTIITPIPSAMILPSRYKLLMNMLAIFTIPLYDNETCRTGIIPAMSRPIYLPC